MRDAAANSSHDRQMSATATGEGGMLVTSREDLCERCLFLRDHGRKPGDKMFWFAEVAYKYKVSSLQAALGLAQLERIEELVDRKRAIFQWYAHELEGVPGITINCEPPGTRNTYWMVTVVLDKAMGIGKKNVIEGLGMKGIDCRPFFHPLSSLPAYAMLPGVAGARARNPVTYDIAPYGVNLPSGFNLTGADVKHICRELKGLLSGHPRNSAAG